MSRPAFPHSLLALATLGLIATTAPATAPLRLEWAYPSTGGAALHGLSFPSATRGYAVGVAGIVLRSDDDGTSWTRLHDHNSLAEDLIDVHAVSENTLVAIGTGIIRSTDGGGTFASVPSPQSGLLRDLTVIPGGDLSAAGANGKVLRSTDAGLTWSDVGPGVGNIRHHTWTSSSEAYAVGENVAHRTTDNGDSWTQFTTPPAFGFNDVTFVSPTRGIASEDFGYHETTDGGETWQSVFLPVEPLYRFRVLPLTDTHWYLAAFGEGAEIHETTDGGETWLLHDFHPVLGYTALAQTPTGRLVWCSDVGEIRYSDNGGPTVLRALGPFADAPSAPISYFLDRGDGTLFATNQPSSSSQPFLWLRSDDGGRSWSEPSGSPHFRWAEAGDFGDLDHGFVARRNDIAWTDDGGDSWNAASLPADYVVTTGAARSPSVFFAHAYRLTSSNDLFRSTDGGATWTAHGAGLPGALAATDLTFFDAQNGVLTGANGGAGLIYRTSDGGDTWTFTPHTGMGGPFSAVAWIDAQAGVASVNQGFDQGLYRTTDAGASWTMTAGQTAQSLDVRADGVGLAEPRNFLNTTQITTDGGVTWSPLEVPFTRPFDFGDWGPEAIAVSEDGLLIGGPPNAIFFGELATATDAPTVRPGRESPLSLSSNWPEPFAEQTHVSFELAREENARVQVVDVRGRVLRTLRTGRHLAGSHTVQWDGNDAAGRPVAAGVYFVRVHAGGVVRAEKLTRLR